MAPLAFLLALPGSHGALGAAGYPVGVGGGASWRGRAIDRSGMRTGLRREALILAGTAALVSVALAVRAPLVLVLLTAVGLGIAGSAIGVAYRAALEGFVRDEALPSAYTKDAVLTEVSFVVSPLVAGVMLALAPAPVLFGVCGVLALCAFTATGALPRTRPAESSPVREQRGWLRAAAPVYLVTAVIGLGYGLLMAGLPQRTAELAWPSVATTAVFALMSLASAGAGLVFVRCAGPARGSAAGTVAVLCWPFALATALLALVGTGPVVVVAMALFGASLAPLSGISTTVITTRVPAGTHARALAFAAAMITIPSGAGFSAAAVLIEVSNASAILGFATLVYTALALTLTAWVGVRRARDAFTSRLP
jgi:MFS family permease